MRKFMFIDYLLVLAVGFVIGMLTVEKKSAEVETAEIEKVEEVAVEPVKEEVPKTQLQLVIFGGVLDLPEGDLHRLGSQRFISDPLEINIQNYQEMAESLNTWLESLGVAPEEKCGVTIAEVSDENDESLFVHDKNKIILMKGDASYKTKFVESICTNYTGTETESSQPAPE